LASNRDGSVEMEFKTGNGRKLSTTVPRRD
jgi:hypothetical protein